MWMDEGAFIHPAAGRGLQSIDEWYPKDREAFVQKGSIGLQPVLDSSPAGAASVQLARESIAMNELAKALIANSAFAPARNILQAISESDVHQKPATMTGAAPHSIYDEVWHMAFWQDITLDWVQGKATAYPAHAAEGFPADVSEPWDSLRERFLAGTQNAAAIANDTERLEIPVLCPRPNDPQRTMTVREQLESLAAHNGYHLGRVVLLRQMLGNWPPPDGGDTW